MRGEWAVRVQYVCVCVGWRGWKEAKRKLLSLVRLFATPWTIAYQALLSMESFRQE